MIVRTLYLPFSLARLPIKENTAGRQVALIQHLLKLRHLYEGSIHSCYDDETKEAVSRFQEKERLLPTGNFDPITYCRLHQAKSREISPQRQPRLSDLSLSRANILITKSSRELTLFDGNTPIRQYPVAIGKPSTPTPLGNFSVALKKLNPGGLLGSRWLGLNYSTYGIHGTNQPWLIGKMVSHGCIRMHNQHVEELYILIRVGTPVYIRD
jgi:peptidoglycan hydrolase-like protein with peptidoglycan-binding domain